MKRTFALGLAGALAAGAALFAAPQAAHAQFLSIGIGGPAYGYGYGYSPYNAVGYGYGAPAYYGYNPYVGTRVVSSYGYDYDDYAEPVVRTRRVVRTPVYYAQPRRVVRQRVVTRAPRVVTRVGNPYPFAAPHEIRGGQRTVIVQRSPVRRAVVDRSGRIVRYY
ncbi:MAG TPA: hypothetical protein VIL09_15235 [Microvirga sp.]|jgi:hypothetical protein